MTARGEHARPQSRRRRVLSWAIPVVAAAAILLFALLLATHIGWLAGIGLSLVPVAVSFAVQRLARSRRTDLVVVTLWHETLAIDDTLNRRLVGVFTSWEEAESGQQAAVVLPGFRAAPESFALIDDPCDVLSAGEHAALVLRHRHWRLARPSPTAAVWAVWGGPEADGYLLQHGAACQGFASTQANAELIGPLRADLDDRLQQRLVDVPMNTLLWPDGYHSSDRGIRPLLVD